MTHTTILLTGASSGIGRATASLLLEHGYHVIGLARDFSKFPCKDKNFTAIPVDLSALDTLPSFLEQLIKEHGPVDGVICNAGKGRFASLEEFSYAQIRSLLELNLTSQIYLVRALLPGMKQRKSGTLIFMGSETALDGAKRGTVYSASKFGLRGLAQSLRLECATSGVRVGIINPGMVKTEFFDQLDFQPGVDPDNYILPEDVAEAVLLVLEARYGTVFDEINLSPQKKVILSPKPANK
ncbi:MAG: SDR family oxidoreductase [Gammaproteobacteria bacterium]|jgi:NADP-dependent 3-hydroxy acid dehydrogenase YdfG|nr:SDR family oxidoreductase [Gammaproteobacteria bacterium]